MPILSKYFSDFTATQETQFAALGALYSEWNSKINVISRKDIDSLYERHVLHSLSIAAVFDFPAGLEIIDIGTGGGFPGIPLAIFFPEVRFHLVDSIYKKLRVVEAIKQELSLHNVTTQHCRAEDIKGRKFDFAVSRAVAPLVDLWRWAKPLLKEKVNLTAAASKPGSEEKNDVFTYKPGLICLKGGDLTQEISDSGQKPRLIEIDQIFKEELFREKYLLYVK